MRDFTLKSTNGSEKKNSSHNAWNNLSPLLKDEKKNISIALVAVLVNSVANLFAPVVIAYVIDTAIRTGNFTEVMRASGLLAIVYVFGLAAGYVQTIHMGTVGRGVLFKLRNALFTKLSSLPIAFFNQNKAGDLISRINNDTDKLNQFFAQALMQFLSSFFIIIGSGALLLTLHFRLGLVALVPALCVLIITQILSPWVKSKSREGLQSLGALSAEIQESIANFKVVVAFNRMDYFRTKFEQVNGANYAASVRAGIASNIFAPLYTLAANIAQLMVLGFGVILIKEGNVTVGLLIGYLLYVTTFYNPLRQLASVWSSLQLALASLDRIHEVLVMESDLSVMPPEEHKHDQNKNFNAVPLIAFNNVSFGYPDGKKVLHKVSFTLEAGKTYALVGPTGGGKTTTASLMARLFDPVSGTISLRGNDIRTYAPQERAAAIGFILQEPFLFSGTIRDNIVYGNDALASLNDISLRHLLQEKKLDSLLDRFSEGLSTKVTSDSDGISLGQKQLIAFMRAVLREPDVLILDEATANIDTVTEQLLDTILMALPETTTKVIIAHRLNTIQNADTIFFVNGGTITEAGSMENAVELLLQGAHVS